MKNNKVKWEIQFFKPTNKIDHQTSHKSLMKAFEALESTLKVLKKVSAAFSNIRQGRIWKKSCKIQKCKTCCAKLCWELRIGHISCGIPPKFHLFPSLKTVDNLGLCTFEQEWYRNKNRGDIRNLLSLRNAKMNTNLQSCHF